MVQIQMARGGEANRAEAAAIRVGPNECGKKSFGPNSGSLSILYPQIREFI